MGENRFQALFEEMERRGFQIQTREMRGGKLFVRAEAPSPDDYDAIWDRIRKMDPDMRELQPVISVKDGTDLRQERPSGVSDEQRQKASKHVRQSGDRGSE